MDQNNSNTTTVSTQQSSNSNDNNNNNDIILKLIFPPTSSIITKTILAKPTQKASEIISFASQLAGLQPGYSLYLSNSKITQRGQWIDDESLLSVYGMSGSEQVQIKRRPGFRARKNTFAQLKGFKEGKVQKLSTFARIWNPRYLRLYSQRIVHSASENDTNTEFITFSDIVNVDRDLSRKYSFIIICRSTKPGSEEREVIFRCTNQTEMEEWVSSIRTMLKKSRPDLFLPPLSIPFNSSSPNLSHNNNNSNSSSATGSAVSTPTSTSLSSSVGSTPTFISSPIDNMDTSSSSSSSNNNNNNNNNNTLIPPTTPDKLVTKGRSFSFSLSAIKKKQRESPPEMSPMKTSISSTSLEDELRKVRTVLDKETKQKVELEKKYKKLKQKYSTYKKNNKPDSIFTRSRSFSTSAAPPPQQTQQSYNQLSSSSLQQSLLQQQQQQQSQQLSESVPTITFSTPSKPMNPIYMGSSWTPGTSPYAIGASRMRYSGGMTEPDISNSTETETFSVMDDDEEDEIKRDEIKELREQLVRVKEKMSQEMQRREEAEFEKKVSDRELFKKRKMEERKERELATERERENDQLEAMSEITERLKDSLIKLKTKLEEQEEEERLSQSYDGGDSFISDVSMEQAEEAY